jgi:hypothetical protein
MEMYIGMLNSFSQRKWLIVKYALLIHLYFNKFFENNMDASKVQLGACILQEGTSAAFDSWEPNLATTTERKCISIVGERNEFRNILFGKQMAVHTEHTILHTIILNSDRVVKYGFFIEEYSMDFHCIKRR